MRYYRQHPVVLVAALLECLLLGLLGMVLTLRFGQKLFLSLVVLAVLSAVWRGLNWVVFSLRLKGQKIALRSLRGLIVRERVISYTIDGLRMQQNVPGYLLDYGDLQIETCDEPVRILYIAGFSSLRQQIDWL
jgi:hypothetical protein